MKLDSLWFGQAALAALGDVAFAVAVGSALIGAWLANDGAKSVIAPSHPAWRQSLRSLAVAAAVLVLADVGWLVYQAAAMSGAGLRGAFGAIPLVLEQTHVGHAWAVACGGALLLFAVALARPSGPSRARCSRSRRSSSRRARPRSDMRPIRARSRPRSACKPCTSPRRPPGAGS